MWAILWPLLIKYALPELIKLLVKEKIMSELEAAGIENAVDFVQWAKTIKTYREYPGEKPSTTANNLNKD